MFIFVHYFYGFSIQSPGSSVSDADSSDAEGAEVEAEDGFGQGEQVPALSS